MVSAEDLLPANPDVLEGVDDLMELSYLNEPSVLHNLQYRYSHDLIYVCLIINLVLSKFLSIFIIVADNIVILTVEHVWTCSNSNQSIQKG